MITSLNEITPEWLTYTLEKNGLLNGEEVSKITRRPCNNIATSGCLYRLNVSYNQRSNAPSAFVLKLPATEQENETIAAKSLHWWPYRREMLFYLHLSDKISPFVPQCYDSGWDESSSRFHLLLEDCLPNRYQVNWEYGPNIEELEHLVQFLADLHAKWWGDNRRYAMFPPLLTEAIIDEELLDVKDLMNELGSCIEKKHISLFYSIAERWSDLVAYQASTPLTLCHGDLHMHNVFFNKLSYYGMKVVDWQLCHFGYGVSDLANIFGVFLHPYTRRQKEITLLKKYCDRLRTHQIHYSFENCYHDYKIEVTKKLILPLIQKNIPNLHKSAILQCLRNSIIAFEDLVGGLENEIFRGTS